MSRINGMYSPVNPQRVNPEFIGIGQKFSQRKRSRLQSEKHRKNVEANFSFTIKLNQQLQRSLLQKQKQLMKLQSARQRHTQDIRHKKNQQQRKRRQLAQLKQKSREQRFNMIMGIRNARTTLHSQRRANKNATKQQLSQLNQLSRIEDQAYKNQINMRHHSVEMGKKIGNERVNEYYRNKNYQSYNNYMRMIQQQDKKSDQNIKNIRSMNSQMKRLQKRIKKKQNKLKQVMDQINMYAIDCQSERKANFLATVSVFRPASTSVSWRSKPTDVLRSSMNKSKIKQIQQTI